MQMHATILQTDKWECAESKACAALIEPIWAGAGRAIFGSTQNRDCQLGDDTRIAIIKARPTLSAGHLPLLQGKKYSY